jgi:hypothetical protein
MQADLSKITDANLLSRYRNLDRAMWSIEDGDEYTRCMARMDELGAEIQRRGLELPELSKSEAA